MHFRLSDNADNLRAWGRSIRKPFSIRLVKTEDPRSLDLERFLKELAGFVPALRLESEEAGIGRMPGFELAEGWRCHLVPDGRELQPFLDLLSLLGNGRPEKYTDLPESVERDLAALAAPLEIKLYVTTQCPHCPGVVKQVVPLPLVSARIHVTLIDGLMFPELARTDQVKSAPTVICDDQFRWVGRLPLQEMADVMLHRDPSRMGRDSMERMIKGGEASGLAEMMIEKGKIFPAYLDLLPHPEISVRLGAMVVAEAIGERDPGLARAILESLWNRLPGLDIPVRGDMVYLFGELGDAQWAPRLKGLLSQETPREMKESVLEALEKLEGLV